MIDLTPLKLEVRATRPAGDPLREAVLAEPDLIPEEAYPAKVRPWLVLLRLRGGQDGP